ncbi:Shedu anti-phage system protein SduA domain-containing protein [Micromonospora eburnea]|uniref:Shedu anti-phage system protein SduA domain-containing protein n=1 Tax=Micromonospora eburnea TaxID=227316 RepID=UPI000B8473E6|nr:Shedu anti-phage system protein SduA domain-containing protein [Micromonospora eburnea]
MVENDWRTVVAWLRQLCAGPTPEQRTVAKALAVQLGARTPVPVAAALLRAQLRLPLSLPAPRPIGDAELDYLQNLAGEVGLRIPGIDAINDRDTLDAWIMVARARQSIAHLRRLKPEVGDVVVTVDRQTTAHRHRQLASLSRTGRLNFRGGRGGRTWPQFVTRVVKPASSEYPEVMRLVAEELAASDKHPELVSDSDLRRLAPWKVERTAGMAARVTLRDAIMTAAEERPLQVVLERHPEMLAQVVSGNHGTWVRPQVQFGNHYMADFLIAARTSMGLRWTLVELESPTKRLTNASNGKASPTLRHAVDQIEDWRAWLTANLAVARSPREEGGLGLPGITADARGLIIIGRESVEDSGRGPRELLFTRNRIEVRTYDWLLKAVSESHPLGWGLLEQEVGWDDEDEPF